jgi:hypothetical protein
VVGAAVSCPAALARRASDVVVSQAGFSVDGGRHHGLTVAWPQLAQGNLQLTRSQGRDARLLLDLAGAKRRVLASCDEPGEEESLDKLAHALRRQSRPDAGSDQQHIDRTRCEQDTEASSEVYNGLEDDYNDAVDDERLWWSPRERE